MDTVDIVNIMRLEEGTHEVRFLPNYRDPSDNIITKEIFRDFQGICTREEYTAWKAIGDTQCTRAIKHYCYAILDNVPCLITFGDNLRRAITSLMNGEAYFNLDGGLSFRDSDSKITFDRRINAFDISENVSVKFTLEKNYKGTQYINLTRYKFIFDEKNVLWKKGTDTASITQKLKDWQKYELPV